MRWGEIIERLKRASGLSERMVAALERRRAFRVSHRFALLGLCANGKKVPLMAVNVATSGMRVEASERLRRGESIVLRGSRPDQVATPGADDPGAPARVVWVRRRRNQEVYELGLQFQLDTPQQAKAVAWFLLDECRAGVLNPRENRRAPRVPAAWRARLTGVDCNSIDVAVRDIAVGGVLVTASKYYPRDSRVDLEVYLPQEWGTSIRGWSGKSGPLLCHGTVVRARQVAPHRVELGIAFTSVQADHEERLVACLSYLLSPHD